MSRLRLFTSNRLEILADRLAESLRTPLSSPLAPEVVVVPSPGMGRWLSQELARRLGAWMNGRHPLPNEYLDELFRAVTGAPESPVWDPEVLRWRVLGALPGCLGRPGFEPLEHYLGGEARQLKRFQLAGRLAGAFDGYALFRPKWLLDWEAGARAPDGWQDELWRRLAAGAPPHRAALRREFLGRLRDRSVALPAGALPERVSVFGLSALPPFHLEALAALGDRTEVSLYLLGPCREYWADIAPAGRCRPGAGGPDLHFEEGNRLLASLGRAGREFFDRVPGLAPAREEERWEDPGDACLLHALQSDILNLREPAAARPWDPADDSVRLCSCHSPLREVEVLRDCLLDLFDRHPELEPRHVVVLTPDIEAYAPFVEAVFDGPGEPRIPFSVADRGARSRSPLADAFPRALGLAGGRAGAAQVLDLLEVEAVRLRFGFTPADVERAHGWVRETHIRWGADAESRERLGLPPFGENTWRAGLDRLLLGYALPGGGERLFGGILPWDDLEGGEAQAALGRLAEFTDRLFGWLRRLEAPRPLGAWAADLGGFFEALFLPGEGEEREASLVRRAVGELAEAGAASGFGDPVDLEVVRSCLEEALGQEGLGGGFLAGGVTFCAVRPLRSIPFPVVCFLGLDDGAFPRPTPAPGLDLAAASPQPGDRSPRHEDRYAFLEALLAARRHLHLSWVGQSARDGAELPPSVVVSELLDAVEQAFEPPGSRRGPDDAWARRELVTRHRLQAFSPAYFEASDAFSLSPGSEGGRKRRNPAAPGAADAGGPTGAQPALNAKEGDEPNRPASDSGAAPALAPRPPLFSYSTENGRASRHLAPGAPRRRRGLFLRELPEPPQELRRVDLSDLVRFLGNPARHLFAVRLRLRLDDEAAVLDEREPFELDGLERYGLGEALAASGLAGRPPAAELPALRARGLLPHGGAGESLFGEVAEEVGEFLRVLAPRLAGEPLDPLPFERAVDTAAGRFVFSGRLAGLRSDGLLLHRPADLKPKDRLRLWASHLALNLAAGPATPRASAFAAKDEVLALGPIEGAEALLAGLLELYWEGLRRVVPFFPRASWAYARARFGKGKERGAALASARSEWDGGHSRYSPPGESEDPCFAHAFGDADPLDREFEDLSERVFRPLLEAAT